MDVKQKSTYKWYPVYTNPRAEKKAQTALQNKGILTYLPLRRQQKQWSDRKKWVEEPLFKSYIFVYITEQEQTEVLMTKGIARFIYFGNKVASMPAIKAPGPSRSVSPRRPYLVKDLGLKTSPPRRPGGLNKRLSSGAMKGNDLGALTLTTSAKMDWRTTNPWWEEVSS